jgi:hypothetical protein
LFVGVVNSQHISFFHTSLLRITEWNMLFLIESSGVTKVEKPKAIELAKSASGFPKEGKYG